MNTAAYKNRHPIGVFDSGIGGLSVLRALRAELPHEAFVYLADSAHAPYGERNEAHVIARSRAVVAHLLSAHRIKALVIACNTATAAAIHLIRAEHPGLPIIGVEPALKPAVAISQTGHIGVLATRGTLTSAKFGHLMAALNGQAHFRLQACDGLAEAIENECRSGDATPTIALCQAYTAALGSFGGMAGQIDTLVLGCTHYPFASAHWRHSLGKAQVHLIDTGQAVARQTRRLLDAAGLLAGPGSTPGEVTLITTGNSASLHSAARQWLQLTESVRTQPV